MHLAFKMSNLEVEQQLMAADPINVEVLDLAQEETPLVSTDSAASSEARCF